MYLSQVARAVSSVVCSVVFLNSDRTRPPPQDTLVSRSRARRVLSLSVRLLHASYDRTHRLLRAGRNHTSVSTAWGRPRTGLVSWSCRGAVGLAPLAARWPAGHGHGPRPSCLRPVERPILQRFAAHIKRESAKDAKRAQVCAWCVRAGRRAQGRSRQPGRFLSFQGRHVVAALIKEAGNSCCINSSKVTKVWLAPAAVHAALPPLEPQSRRRCAHQGGCKQLLHKLVKGDKGVARACCGARGAPAARAAVTSSLRSSRRLQTAAA